MLIKRNYILVPEFFDRLTILNNDFKAGLKIVDKTKSDAYKKPRLKRGLL